MDVSANRTVCKWARDVRGEGLATPENREHAPRAFASSNPSSMAMRVLHQFPISHFCEKTRWHLDWKELEYTPRNLLPVAHVFVNRRLGGKGSVPLLIDFGHAVSDSTDIALYLESQYPGRRLLPADPSARARCLELEEYFDRTFGPAIRRFMYGHALQSPGLVRKLFFGGYGPRTRVVAPAVLGTPLETVIRRQYRIDEAGIQRSSKIIDEAVDRLEAELHDEPSRYLVGNQLTVADVTAASLLGPLVAPPGSPWADTEDAPPAVISRRETLRARVAGRWVLERYAHDRPPSAAVQ